MDDDDEDRENRLPVSLVDPAAELFDPTPDLKDSFQLYNFQFFNGDLSACTVLWSKRMFTCAGTCTLKKSMITIRLSEPLLKLRPRKDFVETLLVGFRTCDCSLMFSTR